MDDMSLEIPWPEDSLNSRFTARGAVKGTVVESSALPDKTIHRGRRWGAAAIRQQAVEVYASLLPRIQQGRATMTLQAITDRLNESGEPLKPARSGRLP